MHDSAAIKIGRSHIEAWGNHDWDKTRTLLAPDVHVVVASLKSPM